MNNPTEDKAIEAANRFMTEIQALGYESFGWLFQLGADRWAVTASKVKTEEAA